MVSHRARANHALYLASIVLQAWERERAGSPHASSAVDLAFAIAAIAHLRNAYGWFLLAVHCPERELREPPRSCAELPPQPEGRALNLQIEELMRMEEGGWLAQLLGPLPEPGPAGNSERAMALLSRSSDTPDPEQLRHWHGALSEVFDRMSDTLDEC